MRLCARLRQEIWNQQALEDVRPTSQVRSPHPACFVQVCERALDSFATHAL